MSFTDDYSHQTVIHFLKEKSQALTSFKQYEAWLTRQCEDACIKTLQSDWGGEYLSDEFNKHLQSQGIKR
jgi:hypothetical protein